MKFKRNVGLHTPQAEIESRILGALEGYGGRRASPSSLGYVGYPDYFFKTPQGAAMAAAKVLRGLRDRGLITREFRGGFYLTTKGEAERAAQLNRKD